MMFVDNSTASVTGDVRTAVAGAAIGDTVVMA
jgi:hypothetical protein